MAEDINQAIARYLQRIHDELVRPVILERSSKQYRPDRLVLFQEVSMRAFFRAASLFKPAGEHDCKCGTNDKSAAGGAVRALSLGSVECQAVEASEPNE